jgi:hypothetical protein
MEVKRREKSIIQENEADNPRGTMKKYPSIKSPKKETTNTLKQESNLS